MTVKRQVLIQPFMPDYTENLGDNTGQYADTDIAKAVKYSGDTMILCADGDEIEGFVQAVHPGTKDGHSLGSVRKNGRVEAADEAGTLSIGDLVVSGVAGTLGTSALQNVKVAALATSVLVHWKVIRLAATPAAGTTVLLERL